MTEFDGWADYYDFIHDGLPGETEFYVGHAVRRSGRTLELGCGTGRIAIPMAMSGVDVVGLDNSARMLARCREKHEAVGDTPGQLLLVCADMASFVLDARFDFIAMPYRTFMHLLTKEDQRRCLETVARHLASDGEFILNTWVPHPFQIASAVTGPVPGLIREVGRYALPGTEDSIIHFQGATADHERQWLVEEHIIREENSEGDTLHEVSLSMTRAWVTAEDMNRLVRDGGFSVQAVFGDFDCNPFTDKSEEMIWVLRAR